MSDTKPKAKTARNWSKSTLLLRLAETMAEEWGGEVNDYLTGTGSNLDILDRSVVELVAMLKDAIVKEALTR